MRAPQDLATLKPVPHGRTARRIDWLLLPPEVRRLVETRLGSPVAHAESAGSGYTPGLASVLTCENGERTFLKAASTKAQAPFADAYREEIHKLRALPPGLPVPRLLWSHVDDLWVILALEYVAGGNPARPWRPDELDACLDCLEVLADSLTPPPMPLRCFSEEFADCMSGWDHVRQVAAQWPHLAEAEALAGRFVEVTCGRTLVHTDARDDNFLLAENGPGVLCDWNWPVVGAAWIDTVLLLISAHGDGLDADALIAERRLTRDVDPEHVDVLLALVCGYFLEHRDGPVPNSSPYIRLHQSWYAETTWSWLASRRRW